MSLVVIVPGVFSTVQDLGRTHFRSFGVPLGGAFDVDSASLANALVGNGDRFASLEMTFVGGTFEADQPIALALCGAPMAATLRPVSGAEVRLDPPIAFGMDRGDRLVIGATARGARTYLAVRGGWQTAEILGSRSSERPLGAGDTLHSGSATTPIRRIVSNATSTAMNTTTLRFVAGPDHALADPSWHDPERMYQVDPRSDRMGIRLDGPACDVIASPERLSTPVLPGTVQMAGGLPLVLGVACGTMGGYPHVAQVISADLVRLAQARPGDWIAFESVSLEKARQLLRARHENLQRRCLTIRAAVSDGIVDH